MDPHVRRNRDLWDELADINVRSAFYDVEGFRRAATPLDDEVLAALGDVGGCDVLHLQCHFGMDTLRLAKLARRATGVDFSPRAIDLARRLSDETGIAARFVESDVYALPDVLDETFDVVFSSYGVLGWLPDVARWGQLVARYLRPGGRFAIVEGHPTMWMFDSAQATPVVRYPYFAADEPIALLPAPGSAYADPDATVTHTEYSWSHSMADILGALLDAGLRITSFREYDHAVWRAFPHLVETRPGRYEQPGDGVKLPLLFALTATKPA